jgi:C4-dicarboxylate transporter DctM subunit
MIMFIICMAYGFAYLMANEQIPLQVANFMLSLTDNPILILLMVNVLLLILGAVMDNVSAMVILSGVLTTIGVQVGMDPIQLGAMVVINFAVGMVTPPVGYSLFVASAISGLKIDVIARRLLPFMLVFVVLILLITFVPAITTWLPSFLD